MGKKYFCISDIHSFAIEMQAALYQAGFRKSNKDHILLICGDIFDRGPDTLGVYKFIKSIPKNRRILVKGNHESLYMELLKKDFPSSYDFSNGTVRSFVHIAGVEEKDNINAIWGLVQERVAKHEITKWLNSKEWLDFYELNSVIFVHSFIPTRPKENSLTSYFPSYDLPAELTEVIPNWRVDASNVNWEDARWGCPWKQFKSGLFDYEIKNGKTLVCGHWHASDFHKVFNNDLTGNLRLFYSKNLIALDACTAYSGFCNVLVIDADTNKHFDKFGNILN